MRAWLFGIMQNLRVDQLRQPRLTTHSIGEDDFDMPTRATQTDGLEWMQLEFALSHLPNEQREVLLLVALEESSYADIAATLGIPIGTVMSCLSRGRERLRLIMNGEHAAARLRVVKSGVRMDICIANGPLPLPVRPWQEAQALSYSNLPTSTGLSAAIAALTVAVAAMMRKRRAIRLGWFFMNVSLGEKIHSGARKLPGIEVSPPRSNRSCWSPV